MTIYVYVCTEYNTAHIIIVMALYYQEYMKVAHGGGGGGGRVSYTLYHMVPTVGKVT